jgi:hypothetical protein
MALWRRLSALILIGLVTWLSLSRSLVWVWFNANRDALAEAHCVNRNRPELHCRGACYFGKLVRSLDDTKPSQEATVPVFPKTPEYPLCASQYLPGIPALFLREFFLGEPPSFMRGMLLPGPISPPPELI